MGVEQSLTSKKEQSLRVRKKEFLRRIFGPKKGKVDEGCTTFFHNLYNSPNIVTVKKLMTMREMWYVVCTEKMRNE
jgi:tRNA(Phe) wybutosine-synthesizing methylase Tyw3